MKKILLLLFVSLYFASCTTEVPSSENTSSSELSNVNATQQIEVVSSIIPLASIANYIGGEYVNVSSLVPAGVSPHGFDLKPNQLIEIENADVIFNLDFEAIDGFLKGAVADQNVVTLSGGIELLEGHDHHDENEHSDDEHSDEEYHSEDEDHDDHAHDFDPHVWTSSENALLIAATIRDNLSVIQNQNIDYFANNYDRFESELQQIQDEFISATSTGEQEHFIVFHEAYGYLFEELDIDNSKQIVFRSNVATNPSANELQEIIDAIEENNIGTIFREPQFEVTALESLANEYNLEILVLDPQGQSPEADGYINTYRTNLEALQSIYE